MSEQPKTQTTYPTEKMIEAGAKAAYGTVMYDDEDWPDVTGSVPAQTYREAARNCFIAMMESSDPKNLTMPRLPKPTYAELVEVLEKLHDDAAISEIWSYKIVDEAKTVIERAKE